jgi:hypothetical protein
MSETPLWRQAFDAVERRVTPPAEELVRTPGFAVGAALVGRAQATARSAARGLTARAWHLLNLPAGSDVSRLRAQIGALDREVRRLTVQLENERRSRPATTAGPTTAGPTTARPTTTRPTTTRPTTTEKADADGAQPADDPRPRPARRRTQRPAGA